MSDTTTTTSVSHTQEAQAMIEKIRALRQEIPNIVVPTSKMDNRKLAIAGRVPPQFVEMAAAAVTNSPELARVQSPEPDAIRDLVSYGEAYTVVAEEFEATALLLRHSIAAAKNKAGRYALDTYAAAQRLAKQPETASLAPVVDSLRRTLNLKATKAKEQPAQQPPASPTPAADPTKQ